MVATPEIRWLAAPLVSALHAAEAITSGRTLVESRVAEALAEPVEGLALEIVAAKLPVTKFWSHLLPLAQGSGGTRQLAETAIVKTVGRTVTTESLAARIGLELTALETNFRRAFPKLAEDLALRAGPLREQWEARGPGLLASVFRLTEERLAVPNADVILAQPVLGGGGAAHLLYNSVRIEAVLANPVPELPEVVRLGWLLSQLNLEIPSLSERVNTDRLPLVAQLAMLPVALKAGEDVELCRCDRATIARALEVWGVLESSPLAPRDEARLLSRSERATLGKAASPAHLDMVDTLDQWWATYLESQPGWPVALAALDRMIMEVNGELQTPHPAPLPGLPGRGSDPM